MAGEVFEAEQVVRFAHCDPAGLVFFPHYLVMLSVLHERWFDEGLHLPYVDVIDARRLGLPTVRLECDFTAISRHGDRLRQRLAVARLGRSSLELAVEFLCGDELRARFRQVMVCTSLQTHRPQPWPDDLRSAVLRYARSP